MKFRSILAGAAALALLAMPAFATDFLGGAVKSTDIGGKMVLTDANGMTAASGILPSNNNADRS